MAPPSPPSGRSAFERDCTTEGLPTAGSTPEITTSRAVIRTVPASSVPSVLAVTRPPSRSSSRCVPIVTSPPAPGATRAPSTRRESEEMKEGPLAPPRTLTRSAASIVSDPASPAPWVLVET